MASTNADRTLRRANRPRLRRENIRTTHPLLWWSIVTIGMIEAVLALNFFWYTPTFEPYGVPKTVVGVIFLALGSMLLSLNFLRDLRKVKFALMLSSIFTMTWAAGNTQQVLDGRASWQLPVVLAGIGIWQILLVAFAPASEP